MSPDFDHMIERRGSDSYRWQRHAGTDIIPLWVADMDFRSPNCVIEAMRARVDHGVFGYATHDAELRVAVVRHLEEAYGWRVPPEWLLFLPGVVPGLHAAVRHLTAPGQHVLFPSPVYQHLRLAAVQAPRAATALTMVLVDGRWVLPWDSLDQYVTPQTRMLVFANPHNPGGTVFRPDELARLAEFCCRHDLLLCSDEIHAGLVLAPDGRHTPIASLDPQIGRRTITLMSLSKTFNFAGCGLAWAVVEDPALRRALARDLHTVMPSPSLFGAVATLAALAGGEPWRLALLDYLRGNRDHLLARVAQIPGLRSSMLEASYLAWIDASALGVADPARLFLDHGVALSPGSQFGTESFVRLNFGTPRALLDAALDRMAAAVASLPG